MIELLNSKFQPVKTHCKPFEDVFFEYFNKSKRLTAASGYISEDSIADLLYLYNTGAST